MVLILDTCALLAISGVSKKKLSKKTQRAVETASSLSISACSLYEIALKHKRGSMTLKPHHSAEAYWQKAIEAYEIEVLAVTDIDFHKAVQLPDHHNDPFDRIIIAQATRLSCSVVTHDSQFENYDVPLIW